MSVHDLVKEARQIAASMTEMKQRPLALPRGRRSARCTKSADLKKPLVNNNQLSKARVFNMENSNTDSGGCYIASKFEDLSELISVHSKTDRSPTRDGVQVVSGLSLPYSFIGTYSCTFAYLLFYIGTYIFIIVCLII